MRQLELLLGEAALRDALREYLSRFAFGHASWPDLLQILQARTPTDLAAWSSRWLESAGRPAIRSALVREPRDGWRVEWLHPPSTRSNWTSPLDTGRTSSTRSIRLAGQGSVLVAKQDPAPDFVLPNGRGLGYGEFVLDDRSLAWLVTHLPAVPDALTRGSAWLTLWDAMLSNRLAPERLLDLAISAVPVEESELNLQRMLHDVERLFWVFLEPGASSGVCGRTGGGAAAAGWIRRRPSR